MLLSYQAFIVWHFRISLHSSSLLLCIQQNRSYDDSKQDKNRHHSHGSFQLWSTKAKIGQSFHGVPNNVIISNLVQAMRSCPILQAGTCRRISRHITLPTSNTSTRLRQSCIHRCCNRTFPTSFMNRFQGLYITLLHIFLLMCFDKLPRWTFRRTASHLLLWIVLILVNSDIIDFVFYWFVDHVAESFREATSFTVSATTVVCFAGTVRGTSLWKSPLRTNRRIQQHIHRFTTNLRPSPTSIQPLTLHLQHKLIIQKPSYIPIILGIIVLLTSLFRHLPFHSILMKLSKVTLIQLSIVRNGITPIILFGGICIISKMIVRSIKDNIHTRIHPSRKIVIPLSRCRPPPLTRTGYPPRRDLIRT
mmetsp:Transcript_26467/g.43691  ORF Transcript_26467/g.43691 Transcript_26467/m.43691 type:complete len:362 (-) Transcript_26467:1284-2369(-)